MEIKRKLATIRTIADLRPIDGADMIEIARIDGWECIVKKGEFAVGDNCVYFEIDSFLPERPEFEFLRKSSYRKMGDDGGFRIKTMRMRGVLSQGLALPLAGDVFFSGEGHDLTDLLGIIKWEPPIPAQLAGQVKGNFPSYIPKTDQERAQNVYAKYMALYGDHEFEVTRKMDGSSCTMFYKIEDRQNWLDGVCSRNLWLKDGQENAGNSFVKIWDKYKNAIIRLDRSLAFQGELVGEGIQGNPHKIKGQEFYLFDVWDIDAQKYLPAGERYALAMQLGMPHVEVLRPSVMALKSSPLEEHLQDAAI